MSWVGMIYVYPVRTSKVGRLLQQTTDLGRHVAFITAVKISYKFVAGKPGQRRLLEFLAQGNQTSLVQELGTIF